MISIWFFIGISLAVNGALVLLAGIHQLISPPANPHIVLFHLHANVWWGAIMLLVGLFYTIRFRPSRTKDVEGRLVDTKEATWRS